MALSNAERQKRYREIRKEKVSELDTLRNEIKLLQSQLQLTAQARDNFSNHNRQLVSEVETLRNELQELRTVRKKSRNKISFLDESTAFFYVENGVIKLLQWPETIGTVKARHLDIVPYGKIDKKYRQKIDNLIIEFNNNARELNKACDNAP